MKKEFYSKEIVNFNNNIRTVNIIHNEDNTILTNEDLIINVFNKHCKEAGQKLSEEARNKLEVRWVMFLRTYQGINI